jgi:hypothetical protein
MGEVAKCTSWRGHKFEGRYTKGPATIPSLLKVSIVVDSLASIYERFRPVTYERDICVRCGATVEKQTTKPAETQATSTI